MNSKIKPSGIVTLKLFDAEGKLKQEVTTHNMIVSSGCNLIASVLANDNAFTRPSHMAIGTNSTSPARTNVALGAEIVGSRTVFDSAIPTRNEATITYVTTFNPGIGTGAVVEVGIFNASSGGTMLNRAVFPVVNKESSDTLIIQWSVTIS